MKLLCVGLILATAGLAACASIAVPVMDPQEKLVMKPVAGRRDDLDVLVAGRPVAHSPTYQGLAQYVRCVPHAVGAAEKANRYGKAGRGLSYSGAGLFWSSLAVGAFGNPLLRVSGNCPNSDCITNILIITNTMLVGMTLGKIMELLGADYQRTAHVQAQAAVNRYNEALSNLGPRCEDPNDAP